MRLCEEAIPKLDGKILKEHIAPFLKSNAVRMEMPIS